MLTTLRFQPPRLTGDWKVDGPQLMKVLQEYWLALEQKGVLAIEQASVDGTPIGANEASTGAFTTLSITSGAILPGTYTPTLTNVANLDGSTAFDLQYVRIGSFVVVSGQVNMDPTANATQTTLGISLPIASAFTSVIQLGGTSAGIVVNSSGSIRADDTNDRAQLSYISQTTANHTHTLIFAYQIL